MDTPTTAPPQRLLGIDWGTSNRRAYLVDADGACLAAHEDEQGVLAAAPDFAGSLAALLAAMGLDGSTPVIASGMIGSAQDWREIPYLDIAVPLTGLPRHLRRIDDAAGDLRIVPGYSWRAGGRADVMRGEETQLLGALMLEAEGADGWYVLPGTHSKWALLEGGTISRFATFMTGELFATLGRQGTLQPFMDGPDDDAAFALGVDEACGRAPLSQSLFGVRARILTGLMPRAQARSFVSGLLIGTELAAACALVGDAEIRSVAAPKLHARYAAAAARLGLSLRALDPDAAYRAALAHLSKELSS